MSDSPPPPLLEMPDGVENLIVSFVSSGVGGLRSVLNLRSACSTTRSWVDHLPKPQADVVFSRAQVKMNSDLESIRRFLASPPSFAVTALSLQVDGFRGEASLEENKSWRAFCSFWNSRLEQLELRPDYKFLSSFSQRLCELLESPNLIRLQFIRLLLEEKETSKLPSCFQRLRELSTKRSVYGSSYGSDFFSQLEENRNLRVLHASPFYEPDFVGYAKLIDLRKEDTLLQMSFDLTESPVISCMMSPDSTRNPSYREVLHKFLSSIVASSSEIRLKIRDLQHFERWMVEEMFPRGHQLKLLSKVELLFFWKPKEGDSYSHLQSLPHLKELQYLVSNDSPIDIDHLTFPPFLEHLGFNKGFTTLRNLPQSLSVLHLNHFECDTGSLVDSLNVIRSRCPRLVFFEINWKAVEGKAPVLNFERSDGFSELKKLMFIGSLVTEGNVEDYRTALSSGFDWGNLELHVLEVAFRDEENRRVPVVDKDILRRLCEGPSAESLLTVEMANEFVTPEGIPLLETLRALVVRNWRRREETEGRGGWMELRYSS